jgi:hypothetical protein
MSRAKQASKAERRIKAVPVLGAAGLSLTLASGAYGASSAPAADVLSSNAADSRNYAARGGNFRGQFGDIPCLRQRKPRRPAARLRLWWWLLPVRASALVRVRKRCLFAPAAPLRSGRRTSTFRKSHNRQPRQRLALRNSRLSFMKCSAATIRFAVELGKRKVPTPQLC